MGDKKVKVALFLEPKIAHELKVQAAMAGHKGLSTYVTRLIKKEPRLMRPGRGGLDER